MMFLCFLFLLTTQLTSHLISLMKSGSEFLDSFISPYIEILWMILSWLNVPFLLLKCVTIERHDFKLGKKKDLIQCTWLFKCHIRAWICLGKFTVINKTVIKTCLQSQLNTDKSSNCSYNGRKRSKMGNI